MMKVKASDLIGEALDWAVEEATDKDHTYRPRNYSTSYEKGGPVIDGKTICTKYVDNRLPHQVWEAGLPNTDDDDGVEWYVCGPTRLVAALRCVVMNELGHEIDVPEEVLER